MVQAIQGSPISTASSAPAVQGARPRFAGTRPADRGAGRRRTRSAREKGREDGGLVDRRHVRRCVRNNTRTRERGITVRRRRRDFTRRGGEGPRCLRARSRRPPRRAHDPRPRAGERPSGVAGIREGLSRLRRAVRRAARHRRLRPWVTRRRSAWERMRGMPARRSDARQAGSRLRTSWREAGDDARAAPRRSVRLAPSSRTRHARRPSRGSAGVFRNRDDEARR